MPAPLPIPAQNFATLIAWLGRAVAAMRGGERLSCSLIGLIIDRLRGINQRVARLAARIGAGKYALRSLTTPQPRATTPRRPNPLPHTFGWLLKMVPDAVGYRAQLQHLLGDPDMAALMQAAPASLGRPLRSLCHMLGLRPPDILAPPAKPRPARPPAAPPKPPPPPPPPPPPQPPPPAWMPKRTRWTLARIRGSPHRA